MFDNLAKDSNIITVKSVTFDSEEEDERKACTIAVRVLNDAKWKKVIQQLLLASADDEEFGVVVKQEYYLTDAGKPAFVWIIYLWGDLEPAETAIANILNKRGGPPPPPASLGISAPVFTKNQQPATSAKIKNDGSIVKEVQLPHKRAEAKRTDEVINVRDPNSTKKGVRAFVTGYNGG